MGGLVGTDNRQGIHLMLTKAFGRLLLLAIIACAPRLVSASPVTYAVEGYLTYAADLATGSTTFGLSSAFSGTVVVDIANATYTAESYSPDGTGVHSASAQIGCRVFLGSICLAGEGPGAPVVVGWSFTTEFGTLGRLPESAGLASSSGIELSRLSPTAVPGGSEFWDVADLQGSYWVSADPNLSDSYTERYVSRSLQALVQSTGNQVIFDSMTDLGIAPDASAANFTYFGLQDIVGALRTCIGGVCSAPTYDAGSTYLEGKITKVAVVPEPGTLALALAAMLLTSLASRHPPAAPVRARSRLGRASLIGR